MCLSEVIKSKEVKRMEDSKLGKEKKLEIVLRDAPELAPLLEDFHSKSKELKGSLSLCLQRLSAKRLMKGQW